MTVHSLKDVISLSGADLLSASVTNIATSIGVQTTPDDTNGSAGLSATPPYVVSVTDRFGNQEVMLVTAVNVGTRTLTVSRDIDGTGAFAFDAGTRITMVVSRATLLSYVGGVPTTQSFGDIASAGASLAWAPASHLHGMPAAPAPGGLLLVAKDDTEHSSSSAAQADIVTLAAVVGDLNDIVVKFQGRVTGTFSGPPRWGLKINGTDMVTSANGPATTSTQTVLIDFSIGPADSSYGAIGAIVYRGALNSAASSSAAGPRPASTASFTVTGQVPSGGTIFVKYLRVYAFPTS